MTITVRPITPADRQAWHELFVAYLRFYETEANDASIALAWHRLMGETPEIHGLVALDDGKLVGFTHFHFQLSTWATNSNCYLEDLFVSESARGKGVATALIEAVKAAAIANRCTELFWITKSSNSTARRLYDKVATLSEFIRYEVPLED